MNVFKFEQHQKASSAATEGPTEKYNGAAVLQKLRHVLIVDHVHEFDLAEVNFAAGSANPI